MLAVLIILLTLALAVAMGVTMRAQMQLMRATRPGAEHEFRRAIRWFHYRHAAAQLRPDARDGIERLRRLHIIVGAILAAFAVLVVALVLTGSEGAG